MVTPKSDGVGPAPSRIIARSFSSARWPWDIDGWEACGLYKGKATTFKPEPKMKFTLLLSVAELTVKMSVPSGLPGETTSERYRLCGRVADRVAFRQIDGSPDVDGLRLFFLPHQGRWMLCSVAGNGTGIESMIARSNPDDGSTWASMWPWCVEAQGWEVTTGPTLGMESMLEARWIEDRLMQVRVVSPNVRLKDLPEFAKQWAGIYEARGMANNRCYYVQRIVQDAAAGFVDPLCLWFAEDRGQWVLTDTSQLGNSKSVYGRITSRAWWPWEAHLGGNTSPFGIGAVPFAAAPVWHEGAAMLAVLRQNWEVVDKSGVFRVARDPVMTVELMPEQWIEVASSVATATHEFLGAYEFVGLISARPYYVQHKLKGVDQNRRHVLWYSEEFEQWVINLDYRLGDHTVVTTRADDSAWFPYETANWEIPDGDGDFVRDPFISVVVSKEPIKTPSERSDDEEEVYPKCVSCGKQFMDESKFCRVCGAGRPATASSSRPATGV